MGLTSLALATLLAALGVSVASVALPTLSRAFEAPLGAIQWVVLAYLVATTTVIVPAGRVGDRIGRRRVLLAALILMAVSSVICGIAPDLPVLILGRVLQGVAAAALMALSLALTRETVAGDRVGRAMGLLGSMSAIGTALGPSMGGILIGTAGWQSVFWAMALLAGIAFWFGWRYLPEERSAGPQSGFDPVGTVLLALTLAAYALAMTGAEGSRDLGGDLLRAGLLVLAAAGLAAFVFVETRAEAPLVRLAALRDPVLAGSLVMNGLIAAIMMTTLVVGPFYLSQALGLADMTVGLVMAVGPALAALSGVPAGWLVDRLGMTGSLVVGLLAACAGAWSLAFLPAILGLPGYLVGIAMLTPGYQLFLAANNTCVMAAAPDNQRGVLSGLLNLFRNLGFVTGASAMGMVFAWAARTSTPASATPADIIGGIRITFAIAGVMAALSLTIAIACRLRTMFAVPPKS